MLPLLPPEVSPLFCLALIVTSFCTSALTGAFGLGGGLLMLVVLSLGLPVATVIPIHGIVQLGANSSRAFIQRAHVDWGIVGWFALGSVAGIAAGSAVVVSVPDALVKILLGAFILWSVFGRKLRYAVLSRRLLVTGGVLTSFATMLVGATGPLVAALLASGRLGRHVLVASHAACLIVQHGLKVLVFGLLGFAYAHWAVLLVLMIAAGFCGAYAGSRLLDRLPERWFEIGFKAVMAVACLHLMVSGLREALAVV